MRQFPDRRSSLHGKRHFLERGERTWTAVLSATRGSGETGPLLLCKFAEGYRCRCDEVMCCEVMEWQRTRLARNRNADRVGIHCFIKEKICLTAMIGIARRLRRSGRMEERSAACGKAGRCFCSRPPAPRAAGAAPTR